MANKVEIIVVAKDETKATYDKVKSEGKKAGEEAGKGISDGISKGMADTKASIEKNGIGPISVLIAAQQRAEKATEKLAEAQKKFGEDSKQAADATLNLAKANISVESSAKNAAASLGKMSPELDKLLKDVGLAAPQIEKIGTSLESGFKKLATSAVKQGEDIGEELSKGIFQRLNSALSDVGPLAPVLTGLGLAAAPFLGAAIVGGLTAALGGGVMAAGITAALQDPGILNAAGELGKMLANAISAGGENFKGPLLDAFKTLQDAFGPVADDMKAMFEKAATWVAPAAEAIASMAQSISGGLADAISGADPVMNELFEGLKELGASLGDLFTMLGENGPQAALGLEVAFTALVATIQAVTGSLEILTKTFGFLAEVGAFGAPMQAEFATLTASSDEAAKSVTTVQSSFELMMEKADGATGALKTLADELKAQTDPMFGLIKAQQDLRTAQTNWTNAVKDHGVWSNEAQAADVLLAKAAIAVQDASGKAADSFNGKLTPSMEATLKAAGVSSAAIELLEQQFKAAHAQGDAFAKTYTAHVVTIYEEIGNSPAQTKALLGGKRTGGTIGAAMSGGVQGNLTLVGEDGPELVSLPYGSSVKTAGMTNQLLEDAFDPHRQNMTGAPSGPGGWDAVITELRALRREVANTSGGSVYLDSWRVGSVQGRQADLYDRAG